MTCEDLQIALEQRGTANATAIDVPQLEAHVRACASCAAYVEVSRKLRDTMSYTLLPSQPTIDLTSIRDRIHRVAGHTSAFRSEGEDDFFAKLYPTTFTACGFSEPSGSFLIVSVPKTPGGL